MAVRSLAAVAGLLVAAAATQWDELNPDPDHFSNVSIPKPNAPYMVDNQHNWFKTAPDKGKQNGPVWLESGSFEGFMSSNSSNNGSRTRTVFDSSGNYFNITTHSSIIQDTGYWLPELAPLGRQPMAGSGYKFYRNVKDYDADHSGTNDATEAINAAIQDGNRCGLECGNTFSEGAIIYFPPGIYKICRPVIQLYYTQFIGDPTDPPTIKGCADFQGIALFDTDPYIPGGNGANWFINQNQFFRQIRNFIFDMTDMPSSTDDNDQPLVPTAIHWQVSQACSLQNLVFNMPEPNDDSVTHVGIFMENGSGGFVSDLVFNGGNIGWRAGSQQYTAINIIFKNSRTAVQMVWDWGFNFQRVEVEGGAIAFNISGRGGDTGQGIGSVSIIDSKISNCPIAVLTNSRKDGINGPPNIVLDNLEMSNVGTTVQDEGGSTILAGTGHVDLWAIGRRYNGTKGTTTSGPVDAPPKGSRLLDEDGKLFYRSRPQYENLGVGSFRIATDHGCRNDGTGDNTDAINTFLQEANDAGQIAYFPAGTYRVGGTVFIPTGSRVQGAAWSQIQGAGFYFNDIFNPRVVVQVGNRGDVGTMEIVEMMFTVQGATAGAIVLEWNVHEVSQGSAAMWDTHVRVGGALGSDLDIETCPKFGYNDNCICASLLFHVTPQASGYFENVWIWLADHDNDQSVYDSPDKAANQISLYAARGTLIESEGPSWFYGTGSEHTVLYQYQVYGAKDIYLGHIQTETPYFQPVPVAPIPFDVGKSFPGDPSFAHCTTDGCKAAWGLRIINSKGVTLHSVGLYSFFQEYYQDCLETYNCQERVCEVKGSSDVVLFNMFTIGTVEVGTGINGGAIFQNESQSGFTTEVSVWLPLPGDDELDVVYVGTEIFSTPSVTCSPPCILVFPTSKLPSSSVVDAGDYTTSFEYGHKGTTQNQGGPVITTFFTTTTTITIDIPPITIGGLPYSNYNISQGQTSDTIFLVPSVDIPPIGIPMPDGEGGTTIRTVTLPPWPAVTRGPPEGPGWGNTADDSDTATGVYHTPFITTITASGPMVTTISFPATVSPITVACPPDSTIAFNTPKTTFTTSCDDPTTFTMAFSCPATKIVTFLGPSAGVFTADCTLATVINPPTTSPPTTTTTDTTTTPLPVWTTWPGGQIIPVTTDVDRPEPTGQGTKTPCRVWFFFICISRDDIHIGGWFWILPPGIYPPGPPPPGVIKFPPGWTIKGTLPPWPQITVGQDHQLTYSEDPRESCTTETGSVCSTTTFVTETASPGGTRTTTSTSSACEEVIGCSLTESNTATATTTRTDVCPTDNAAVAGPMDNAVADGDELQRRQFIPSPEGCPANAIVYPRDPENVGEIPRLLSSYEGKYVEIRSTEFDFTSFYWVPHLDQDTMNNLTKSLDVDYAYYYEEWNKNVGFDGDTNEEVHESDESLFDIAKPLDDHEDLLTATNGTIQPEGPILPHNLKKRAHSVSRSSYWPPSQVSLPKGKVWQAADSQSLDPNTAEPFLFHYDDAAGAGQYVYVIGEEGIWVSHDEFKNSEGTIEPLPASVNFGTNTGVTPDYEHGSAIASKILGAKLGVCKKCTLVAVTSQNLATRPANFQGQIQEKILQQLTDVLDHIKRNSREGKAAISMSLSYGPGQRTAAFYSQFRFILNQLDIKVQAVLVASSNNHAKTEGRAINRYPALFGDPGDTYGTLVNLMVVGSTDVDTYEADSSQYADWMTTFAPAHNAWVVDDPRNGDTNAMQKGRGTSYAAPQVAALAAYLRSLPSAWSTQLQNPANVKKMIRLLHRRFALRNPSTRWPDPSLRKPVIWNGQVGDKNCLIDYATKATWDTDNACPDIDQDLSQEQNDGQTVQPCAQGAEGNPLVSPRQDGGESCPYIPGDSGDGQTISYTRGSGASPTCASGTGCGGRLCTGFWCVPSPSGHPPDYPDPKDPNASNPVSSTTINPGPGSSTSVSITDRPTSTSSSSRRSSTTSSSRRSTTSSTHSTTTTKEPPPPPPSPTPENAFIIIALEETVFFNPSGPAQWSRSWQVFAAPIDGLVSVCDDHAVESKVTFGATGNDPGFPFSLGPFEAEGFTCTYEGDEDSLGTLRCDGVENTWCEVVEGTPTTGCGPLGGNPDETAVVVCRW
ncbi:pectin lyase-like protein [Hypoxylon cercidicola]|nr:pectin lyase-like protein [Hypoxylon cercidicola]